MKNKYITITVGILIVIAIVVFGNVFLIKSIDVVFERKPLNVNEANIVEASKIAIGSNIFSLDEKSAAAGIADFYPNNTVYVQSIERVFPNKVIIYVKERTPVLSVAYDDGGEECIPTDIDFQMTRKALIADIDFDKIIIVSGVSVLNTFNTSEFLRLKEGI
ncbi:MAG: FtsQ-type POTRA domain-containing protein, partial [Clostridia bacterium]|nr:FtsQ-type POTRA domain-containing protein [Clostridia bacterium]